MGGMGFIENNKALCMLSVLINTHLLMAAKDARIERFFYSSSACVYNATKQTSADVVALKEEDAYPAPPGKMATGGKNCSVRECAAIFARISVWSRAWRAFIMFMDQTARMMAGPGGAPAAICRKVIQARRSGSDEIDIWGDGSQTRSFMYIDDCIKGVLAILNSDIIEPINLGSSEASVTINQLVDIVEDIAEVKLKRHYDLSAPKGVRGRNSDNTQDQIAAGMGTEHSFACRNGEDLPLDL